MYVFLQLLCAAALTSEERTARSLCQNDEVLGSCMQDIEGGVETAFGQVVESLTTVSGSSASSLGRESRMKSDFLSFLTKSKRIGAFPETKRLAKGKKNSGDARKGSLTFESFMTEWSDILDPGLVEKALDDWFQTTVVADPYQFYRTVIKNSNIARDTTKSRGQGAESLSGFIGQDDVRRMMQQAIARPSAKKNAYHDVKQGNYGVYPQYKRTKADIAMHNAADKAVQTAVIKEIERYSAGLSLNAAKLSSKTCVEILLDDAFLATCFDETKSKVAMDKGSADRNNAVTFVRQVREDIQKHIAETLNHEAVSVVIDSVMGKLMKVINDKGSEFEALKIQPKVPFRMLFLQWLKAIKGSTELGKDQLNFGSILLGLSSAAFSSRLPGSAEVYEAAQRAELALRAKPGEPLDDIQMSEEELAELSSSLQLMWVLLESVWNPDGSFVTHPRDVVKNIKAKLAVLFPTEMTQLRFINGQRALDEWSTAMYTAVASMKRGSIGGIWNEATFKATEFNRAREAYDAILHDAEQVRERAGKAKIVELNELHRMFARK